MKNGVFFGVGGKSSELYADVLAVGSNGGFISEMFAEYFLLLSASCCSSLCFCCCSFNSWNCFCCSWVNCCSAEAMAVERDAKAAPAAL